MAAIEKALWSIGNYQTMTAETALTAGQTVTLGTAVKGVVYTDATGEAPIGVVYAPAASIGQEVVIVTSYPIVPCIAGGAVTKGLYVMPQVGGGLEGRVVNVDVAYSPIATTANVGIVGLALDSATNGQIVYVLLCGSALLGAR